MPTQIQNAEIFHRLHIKGDPVVLFNVWDAGTAKVVAGAGAKAIATGNWSVAAAHWRSDGQALSLDLALANLARIVASVTLPVTGGTPDKVGKSCALAIVGGAIGCNIEDQIIDGNGLYSIADQSRRVTRRFLRSSTRGRIFFCKPVLTDTMMVLWTRRYVACSPTPRQVPVDALHLDLRMKS